MQDARVRYALLTICLACLFGSGYVLLSGRQAPTAAAPKPIVIMPPPQTNGKTDGKAALAPPLPQSPARIYVDVTGAVRRPSLYVLPAESRVMQAILAAGGPTADADIDAINLAQKVADGDKIVVPVKHALTPDAPTADAPTADAPTADAPMAMPHAKISNAGKSNKISPESGEQIALNTATAEQLERLPGIGPNMAARILAYRQQAGGFSKIEELTQITGIGTKKFAKIKNMVTIGVGVEVIDRSPKR